MIASMKPTSGAPPRVEMYLMAHQPTPHKAASHPGQGGGEAETRSWRSPGGCWEYPGAGRRARRPRARGPPIRRRRDKGAGWMIPCPERDRRGCRHRSGRATIIPSRCSGKHYRSRAATLEPSGCRRPERDRENRCADGAISRRSAGRRLDPAECRRYGANKSPYRNSSAARRPGPSRRAYR